MHFRDPVYLSEWTGDHMPQGYSAAAQVQADLCLLLSLLSPHFFCLFSLLYYQIKVKMPQKIIFKRCIYAVDKLNHLYFFFKKH